MDPSTLSQLSINISTGVPSKETSIVLSEMRKNPDFPEFQDYFDATAAEIFMDVRYQKEFLPLPCLGSVPVIVIVRCIP